MLYSLAAEELKSEKLRLEQLLKKQKIYPRITLLYAPRSDGRPRFYFRKPGDTMRTYIRKFTDYYDNGIYPPKNLIITMDDTDKPLDVRLIRQIIEYRILPFS